MTTAEQPAWQIPYAAGPARDGKMRVASVAMVRVGKSMVVVVLRVCKSCGTMCLKGERSMLCCLVIVVLGLL